VDGTSRIMNNRGSESVSVDAYRQRTGTRRPQGEPRVQMTSRPVPRMETQLRAASENSPPIILRERDALDDLCLDVGDASASVEGECAFVEWLGDCSSTEHAQVRVILQPDSLDRVSTKVPRGGRGESEKTCRVRITVAWPLPLSGRSRMILDAPRGTKGYVGDSSGGPAQRFTSLLGERRERRS
jgi:hypothetical protein